MGFDAFHGQGGASLVQSDFEIQAQEILCSNQSLSLGSTEVHFLKLLE